MFLSRKGKQTPYHCFFQVTEIPYFSLHQSPLVQWWGINLGASLLQRLLMSPGQLGELEILKDFKFMEREEKEKPNMKLVFCFPEILGSGFDFFPVGWSEFQMKSFTDKNFLILPRSSEEHHPPLKINSSKVRDKHISHWGPALHFYHPNPLDSPPVALLLLAHALQPPVDRFLDRSTLRHHHWSVPPTNGPVIHGDPFHGGVQWKLPRM